MELIDGVPPKPFNRDMFLDAEGTERWMDRLAKLPGVRITQIGFSRAGRHIYGVKVCDGPIKRSITAGAHADEPAGPIAACLWVEKLARTPQPGSTWYICPQVNPDGAEDNKAWFADPPDLETYLRNVRREGPGDDVEFGYPGNGLPALRPENAAVAQFLAQGAPYTSHASLHSMGTAAGAWFLIGQQWVDRTVCLRNRLAKAGAEHGWALHDMERNGDKGFTRIAPGFCTTPTSTAMREHFKDDPATADKFHLSSMEYVQSLGGDPLVMVSEIPNFAIDNGWDFTECRINLCAGSPAPKSGETVYERSRVSIKSALDAGNLQEAINIAKQIGVCPVTFGAHTAMQLIMLEAMVEATADTSQ